MNLNQFIQNESISKCLCNLTTFWTYVHIIRINEFQMDTKHFLHTLAIRNPMCCCIQYNANLVIRASFQTTDDRKNSIRVIWFLASFCIAFSYMTNVLLLLFFRKFFSLFSLCHESFAYTKDKDDNFTIFASGWNNIFDLHKW